jgi:hypothetical protein
VCRPFFEINKAHVDGIAVAKAMPIEAGAIYLFDKGYNDLSSLGCARRRRLPLRHPAQDQHSVDVLETRAARIGRLTGRLADNRRALSEASAADHT